VKTILTKYSTFAWEWLYRAACFLKEETCWGQLLSTTSLRRVSSYFAQYCLPPALREKLKLSATYKVQWKVESKHVAMFFALLLFCGFYFTFNKRFMRLFFVACDFVTNCQCVFKYPKSVFQNFFTSVNVWHNVFLCQYTSNQNVKRIINSIQNVSPVDEIDSQKQTIFTNLNWYWLPATKYGWRIPTTLSAPPTPPRQHQALLPPIHINKYWTRLLSFKDCVYKNYAGCFPFFCFF